MEQSNGTEDGEVVSLANLVERVQKQMRNLGPRNTSRRLLDECLVALTSVAHQLDGQKRIVQAAAQEIARQRQRVTRERQRTCDEFYRRILLSNTDNQKIPACALEALESIIADVRGASAPAAQETPTDGETPVAHI